jgi:hypothetical protein
MFYAVYAGVVAGSDNSSARCTKAQKLKRRCLYKLRHHARAPVNIRCDAISAVIKRFMSDANKHTHLFVLISPEESLSSSTLASG